MEPMRLERYWTPEEIAESLQVDPSTVRRMLAAGAMPCVDVGGGKRRAYRVADSDYRAYLERVRVRPPAQRNGSREEQS